MRPIAFTLLFSVTAAPALAQSAYTSASLIGDVVRTSHTVIVGLDDGVAGDGEALGFALRIGAALGARWGVELEFARPSEIENQTRRQIAPVPLPALPFPGGVIGGVIGGLIPTIDYGIRVRQRISSLGTLAWARQTVGTRVDLVYLAGAAFHHVVQETNVELSPPVLLIGLSLPSTRTVTYRVGPVVGIEGRIALTDHVRLVPGVRLYGMTGGLVIRGGAALGWAF